MIYLTIEGQEMAGILTAPLVSGQVNFVEIKTMFDSTWDDLNKSYQFRNGDSVNELDSNDEIINLPYEATVTPGTLEINVVGTKLDDDGVSVLKKATTNTLRFKVGCCNLADDPDNCGDVSPTVVEQIRQIAESAEDKATEAERISAVIWEAYKSGELNGKDGKDGTVGKDGADGISPTVATEQTSTGAKITITDVNGTHTAEVLNGKDGRDGADGKDGTMSFEDLTEEQKATLKGDKGDKGDPGEPGADGEPGTNGKDGENGKDGLTPFIGNNGNWWIGDTDTGKPASGSGGGITELPIASVETLGGIKVGEGLEITEDGVLNALGGTSGGATSKILWQGECLESDTILTLNDSIENYDILVIKTSADNGLEVGELCIHDEFIDVKSIAYYNSSNMSNTYNITETNHNGGNYRVYFGFTDDTNIWVKLLDFTDWDNPKVTQVTGIKLGESSSSGDTTPVGNIISFMGTIAPDGYLTCDGAVLNITDYSRLASHFETQFGSKNYFGGDGTTTFAVPDLRNEFLRGYHGDAELQLSGEIGVHQDATKHINTYGNAYGKGLAFGNASDDLTQAQNTDTTETFAYGYAQITGTKYTDVNPDTYYTSRPTNVAVLYCIKY